MPDLPAELVMERLTLYEEYLDEIDPSMQIDTTPIVRQNKVREAITRQLAANGLSRPIYNRKRNLNNIN